MRGSLFLALALYLTACGGPNVVVSEAEDFVVTDENVDDVEVRFLRSVNVEEQAALRGPLLAFYAERAGTTYEEMAETALLMGGLLAPSSLEAALPAELASFGQSLHEQAARRGREGHAMAALTLLARALPNDREGFEAEMARIRTWGEEARSDLGSDFARTMSLIDVWEDVVDVAPTKEAVRILAELYVSAGRASVQLSDALGPEMMERRQVAHFAPFQGAGVFLRFGMFEEAIALLDSARDAAHRQLAGLIQADLGNIRSGNEAGARAVRQISEAFAEAMPEVTLGLCRYGLRAFASDSYFATCVAQHSQGRAGVRLRLLRDAASADPAFQDAATQQAYEWVRGALEDGRLAEARALTEVFSTFSTQPRHVAEMYADVGTAHGYRGELVPAAENLRRAATLGEGIHRSFYLIRLGEIEAAQGQFTDALNHFRAGLDADPASTLVEIGLAERDAGHLSSAQDAWRRATAVRDGEYAAVFRAHWLLGERDVAIEWVRRILATTTSARDLYPDVVTHPEVPPDLVRQIKLESDNPDYGILTVFSSGRPQFGAYSELYLWVYTTLRHEEMPADIRESLRTLNGDGTWVGRLAGAALGEVSEEDLLAAASSPGDLCEAEFYLGIRRLANGAGVRSAREMLERSRARNTFRLRAYRMAREVLDQLQAP